MKKTLKVLNERLKMPIHYVEDYGLNGFLDMLNGDWGASRCLKCYEERLTRTARFAKAGEFDGFTSTLLVSHEQHHNLIREIGGNVARKEGIPFLYRDMRHCADEGKLLAKKASIYSQQYCGCIFSENDRFAPTKKELYKGGGGQ